MKEKLTAYVHELFRDAPDTPRNRELEEEVLQNTLDRYDDLVAGGTSPESAYAQAAANIGDLHALWEQEQNHSGAQTKKGKISRGAVIALAVIGALVVALVLTVVCFYATRTSYTVTGDSIEQAIGEAVEDLADGQFEDGYSVTVGNYYSAYEQENVYTVGNAEVKTGSIRRLMIDWVAGTVTVKAYDGETISIAESEQESEADRLRWRQEGDTLTIRYCASDHMMGIEQKALTVLVPQTLAAALKQVTVDTVSGEVWVSGLEAELLQLWTVSATQHAAGVYEKLEMNTASGCLEFSEIAREVELDTISGDIQMDFAETPNELEFDSTSGSLTVYLPENRSFEAELETVSGTLSSELGKVAQDKVTYTGTQPGTEAELEFETVSGSVQIKAVDG